MSIYEFSILSIIKNWNLCLFDEGVHEIMNHNSNYSKNDEKVIKKNLSMIGLLLSLLLSMCYLSSCAIDHKKDMASTKTVDRVLSFQTMETYQESTITPAEFSPTPTIKNTEMYFNLHKTIDVTQGPVTISIENSEGNIYLYKDAVVTVRLGNGSDVFAYLNLDDLNHNGMNNSDIKIEMTTGSMQFYQLYPINNSGYYFSGESSMDYDSCLSHFPITELTFSSYLTQGLNFSSGDPYCVITNEGRIAIVSFVKESIIYNKDYSQDISVLVTVYNKKIE
jgi:hypothetical protein